MGHIYCNKAVGVSANMTFSTTSLALPPRGPVLPDFFIAGFYGNAPLGGLAS